MWYNQGTISLVQGSTTVIGVGTNFVSNTRAADMFVGPDGLIYEVFNYTNETTLAIKPAYKGPTISNSPDFFIIPIQGYTKLAADRLHQITLNIGSIDDDVAAAAQSALAALNSQTAAHADAAATAADRVQVAADKSTVITARDATFTARDVTITARNVTTAARDEAVAAAATTVGAFIDKGGISLSGGAYPAKPTVSSIWRVTTAGVVSSIDYNIGDQLVYSKPQDIFYKIDGTDSVTSVAGRAGAVVLSKADVGLSAVDNTSDAAKPISDAAAAAFAVRTPTSNRQDTTAGRLLKVGDFGGNGGAPIVQAAGVDANSLTIEGMYLFNAASLNTPETCYLWHIPNAAANYAKQVAFGLVSDRVYVRTQNNGAWSNWQYPVPIVDSLTSTSTTSGLSAAQGKALADADALRYTKTESDTLFDTKSSVNTKISNLGLKTASKADILGTVSQTGGVPTGAIIETGGTAALGYTKFADGTLFCWHRQTFTGVNINLALGALFNAAAASGQNYPAAFTAIPVTTTVFSAAGVVIWTGLGNSATQTAWPAAYPISAVSTTGVSVVLERTAIGRWF